MDIESTDIDVVPTPTCFECRLGGALGSSATADLRELGRAASAKHRNVHLDLTRVTTLEPPGLGGLFGVIRAVRGAGGRVSISADRWLRDQLVDVGAGRFAALR